MAFNRYYRKGRRAYRKGRRMYKNYSTKAQTLARYAKQGYDTYQLVKPFLPFNAEYKRITSTTNTTPGTAPVYGLKNGMAQGTDVSERVGRSVRLTSYGLRQRFVINGAATATSIRVFVVIDLEAAGAQFLQNDFHSAGIDIISMKNPDYQGRFKVMDDFVINLSQDRPVTTHHTYRKIPRRYGRVEYGGAGAAITNINKGSLYLLMVSNEITNFPVVDSEFRVNYLDN